MTLRNGSMLALGAALVLLGSIQAGAQEREMRREARVIQVNESRGWLGVSLDWSHGESGPVTVKGVFPDSPADRAGVRRGDAVVRLNGAAADAEAVRRLRPAPGDTVRLSVRRDGREQEVRVVAERRQGPEVFVFRRGDAVALDSLRRGMAIRIDTVGAHLDSLFVRVDSLRSRVELGRAYRAIPRHLDSLVMRSLPETLPFNIEWLGSRALAGAEFTQMNPGLGRYFETDEGLLALRVAPGSPAARAGLESGDVVVKVDGAEVETLRDLRQAVSRAEEATAKLEVIRQGKRREVTLRWERGDPFGWERGEPLRIEQDRKSVV